MGVHDFLKVSHIMSVPKRTTWGRRMGDGPGDCVYDYGVMVLYAWHCGEVQHSTSRGLEEGTKKSGAVGSANVTFRPPHIA